jgi:osmotically inducible lipoprotein OsmB
MYSSRQTPNDVFDKFTHRGRRACSLARRQCAPVGRRAADDACPQPATTRFPETRAARSEHGLDNDEGIPMKMTTRFALSAFAAAALIGMSGCAGMSKQDRNTAIGAGAGAVGGAVLTGGSAVGTVGGAAVGGVIGHEVSKPKK